MVRQFIGIVVGNIADFVVSFILAIIIMFPVGFMQARSLIAGGAHPTPAQATRALVTSPTFMVLTLIAGAIGSLAGGYIAAWIAQRRQLVCGLLSSLLCIIDYVWTIATRGSSSYVLTLALIGLITSPLLGFLGGKLREDSGR